MSVDQTEVLREELRAARETIQRLNRRAQLAEAAANLKVEDWDKRSKHHGRAYVFELARHHYADQVARLMTFTRHTSTCDRWRCQRCTLGEDFEVHYSGVPDFHAFEPRGCTCGLEAILATLARQGPRS